MMFINDLLSNDTFLQFMRYQAYTMIHTKYNFEYIYTMMKKDRQMEITQQTSRLCNDI